MRIECYVFCHFSQIHLQGIKIYLFPQHIKTMKNYLHLICLIILTLGILPTSQCQETSTLNPTIENAPEGPVCNWSEVTMHTQEYDTYQWYTHQVGGSPTPIDGATEREITLTINGDGFFVFVVVTSDGEEATSDYVQIDLHVFHFDIYISGYGFQETPIGIIACENTDYDIVLRIPSIQLFKNPKWYRNGQLIEDATGYSISVNQTGYYTGSATSTVCPHIEYSSPGGFGLIIHKPETPTITQEGDSLMASWNVGQWYFEEEIIPEATHWILVPEAEGYYSFEYQEYGCYASSDPFYFSNTTGINDELLSQKVSLYPVPAQNVLNITSEHYFVSYEIYDAFGKTVKSGQINGMGIDISNLAGGFYHISLHSPEGKVVKKFIKAK